ncbi:MAG: ADP-glyceromanno-heptose 6-epimerase [Saprospiraceae bacterium]|nr:ADP-glyceromanno-heptose 6-epimerase [Saprospiraceae bacterium]
MIAVTGAAGFIGSCLVERLNRSGHEDLILVDAPEKSSTPNLTNKRYRSYLDRKQFPDWLATHLQEVQCVFHIGARTDTTERNEQVFVELNHGYSQNIWSLCTRGGIPLIYASSAATYGDGKLGYSDDHALIPQLQPLNAYGWSKQKMDCWVLEQTATPPRWAGFKFFNVFGPNEYHKGRMASVIFHAYHQIRQTGKMKLFRSNDPSIPDGGQQRDFIYVPDVVDALFDFFSNRRPNGIYNLGTGQAHPFQALAHAVFGSLGLTPDIEYIDMPVDLLKTYQNYTCAEMQKLRHAGYRKPMWDFGDAVRDYVRQYLVAGRYC